MSSVYCLSASDGSKGLVYPPTPLSAPYPLLCCLNDEAFACICRLRCQMGLVVKKSTGVPHRLEAMHVAPTLTALGRTTTT